MTVAPNFLEQDITYLALFYNTFSSEPIQYNNNQYELKNITLLNDIRINNIFINRLYQFKQEYTVFDTRIFEAINFGINSIIGPL